MSKHHGKPGDIIRIPIEGNHFVFGRMYKDSTIGIFLSVINEGNYLYFVEKEPDIVAGVFVRDFKKSGWEKCGNIPFSSDDAAWPPPMYTRDIINPEKYFIYHRGSLKPSNKDEVRGLHPQGMYRPKQLVEHIKKRMIGGNKL